MQRRFTMVMAAILILAGTATAADEKLVAALKTLGNAVDNMAANISNAKTDADAALLAKVTREALDKGLTQDKPAIAIGAMAGYCKVTIRTQQWMLWSEARDGAIVDHGAKIY
jgi:hypothetical protein